MKPLVIYHADCTDGFGAAFAAWMKFGDEAEYLPAHYDHAEFDPRGREVYILDFSFKLDTMQWIFDHAERVVWLDHHKTAFEMWCGEMPEEQRYYQMYDAPYPYIILDDNKSGALLAWEYFHPHTNAPKFIQHIDDRDRWQFKMNNSRELHAALAGYRPWNFQQWHDLFFDEDGECGMARILDEGAAILRAQNATIQGMVKHAQHFMIVDPNDDCDRYIGLAVNSCLHQSELGHELAKQSGTFGLIWYMSQDGRINCSLRSEGSYDVSQIAAAFGGGGHRNAAGFQTDLVTLAQWLK